MPVAAATETRGTGEEGRPSSGAAAPPTASLASLSLDPPAPAAPAPKNKLAAKMAANRAAKVAAAAPPAPSSSSSAALSTPAPARAPDAAAAPAALPEKKLSKLQQKMLFARASRTQPGAAGGPAPPAAVEPAVPREDAKDAAPRGAPMALDEPPNPLFAAPSALHAPPSLFASALAPAPPPSALAPAAAEAHSRHVAAALGVAAGASPAQVAAFGPSPDDRVLEARKGTALSGGSGGARTTGVVRR